MSNPQRIWLDALASQPLRAEVREAMAPWLGARHGNASSALSREGREAREAIEQARAQVAGLIGAAPQTVHWVSCGTEANHWAVRGALASRRDAPGRVLCSTIEHASVMQTMRRLEQEGWAVSWVPVDSAGRIGVRAVREALGPDTVLACTQWANPECGTLQDLAALEAVLAQVPYWHSDAVAAAGRTRVQLGATGPGLISIASDQLGGPQGVAALCFRSGVRLRPWMDGGGQEGGLRSGTEPVAAIVGFGAAAELASRQQAEEQRRLRQLAERLERGLVGAVDGIRWTGCRDARLAGHASFIVEGVDGEALVTTLDGRGVVVAQSSACTTLAMRPSHVLRAMGYTETEARQAVVCTVGWETIAAAIDGAVAVITQVVKELRAARAR